MVCIFNYSDELQTKVNDVSLKNGIYFNYSDELQKQINDLTERIKNLENNNS
jgi:hypothetical protein